MNRSISKLTGASSHSDYERPTNDYYATDPNALQSFLESYTNDGNALNQHVWECACGIHKNLANYLSENGYDVRSTDISFDHDFLTDESDWNGDILTNPPFKIAQKFIEHALDRIPTGNHVIMLLRIQFLEGQGRSFWLQNSGLKYVYVHSKRIKIWLNNDQSINGNALCFAWFVWQKGFNGHSTIRWIQ